MLFRPKLYLKRLLKSVRMAGFLISAFSLECHSGWIRLQVLLAKVLLLMSWLTECGLWNILYTPFHGLLSHLILIQLRWYGTG